jgi:NADH:ubiquinone oxidoreductase subunit 5 (subunit L)/multisubunit Na+/H+ antiporter MnhA subunit
MPLLPLAGFVVLVAAGKRIGDPLAGWIATIAVAAAFVVACLVLAGTLNLPDAHREFVHNYFTWFHVGGLTVPIGVLVDPLSVTMCMFITGVSALIHLYSIGYMKGDPDYPKFFIYLNLFVFSMLRRMGRGGRLLLLARLVLVPPRLGRLGGQEGVHLQPHRRHGFPSGHLLDLREDRDR